MRRRQNGATTQFNRAEEENKFEYNRGKQKLSLSTKGQTKKRYKKVKVGYF